MTFKEAIVSVKNVLSHAGTEINKDEYDGIIVKRLVASNTLDSNRSTNQTHIAITGHQMDIFPYLCADGYFYEERRNSGVDLKKYFVISISITLHKSNLRYLGCECDEMIFSDSTLRTTTSVVRSKRNNQADQLQVSMLALDGNDFVTFRKNMHEGDYFILLKRKESMCYDAFGISSKVSIEDSNTLSNMNNNFYKDATYTVVDSGCFNNFTSNEYDFDFSKLTGTACNTIFFGMPGCGKSHYIEYEVLKKDKKTKEYTKGEYEKENVIRTTFYQDYSYTDFVGQILPKVVRGGGGEKDTVEYNFNPGPFTLALIQAISNPNKKVALVIEELNRGNAPAIFGDIFQLLDRDENGVSEYGIKNVGLMDYLNDHEFIVGDKKEKYKFTEIKIPGNMSIFATMNTSDQNVYTLDTAFTRRWSKEKIKNSFENCSFASTTIPGADNCTWKTFVVGINDCIAKNLEELQVNEDKQIGVFFVNEKLLKCGSPEQFAYKLFDYLRNDVAKLNPQIIFKPYNTLDDLVKAYVKDGIKVFDAGVQFKNEENNE